MRTQSPILATVMVLAACGSGENVPTPAPAAGNQADAAPTRPAEENGAGRWDLQSSGEGVALALAPESGPAAIRLFCPAGTNRLLVNVLAFRPIASEERLSFGSGGEVAALVADSSGDRQRGGVSGTGEVPANLAALVGGPVSASYGAQTSGPHPAPPADLARGFVGACSEGTTASRPPDGPSQGAPSPCRLQDGEPLRVAPLRGLGTEPFWSVRIEGRCVTYSHPEDQAGTRVWTRFTPRPNGGLWVGALGGQRFELRTRAEPGCSDGMSDRRYPIAVELLVQGERRLGCAAPL